ncbi:hypothetical protein CHLRE_13g592350v5 [Chlamydomonas reinhardtii]|uniref:Uncharacterized protein n=1 Tax=Chlamydomonas reinhardtii TaxID=3055 RepID=A8IWB2_CHLRE|nr:uncharacterized protein CHLRE_13g592350v5 [Chlamydomonas reinhardtii]PNW74274.1 hypothetical protein CHLRE_13g592350v5 [Chlamydomonas reinhardtii]|eukprot:XP_001693084.1 predicted protein [Chlamydomonas reinhardtii]
MKSVSLRGPFAYYERKAAEDDRRIADLETEVRQRLAENSQLNQQLSQQVAENKRLQDTSKAQGEAQEKAQAIIDNLQAELVRSRQDHREELGRLTEQVSSLTHELERLTADSAVLRAELAKSVHQKQVTNTKLDQIRKKLGMSESEAKAFVQELDEARASSKAAREENRALVADNTSLKSQVESRSQHCMTLIGENKRLLEQVSELRSQLQKNQGELWMAKTEQHTAAAREVSSAKSFAQPMVVRETGTKAGGSQNRPPWTDTSKPTRGTLTVENDHVKSAVVRQALALRQPK